MPRLTAGTVIFAALIAGLLAGLAGGLFHVFATEPIIDRAIELEGLLHAGGEPEAPELISRELQRFGLVLGFLVYGVTWGLFFGAAYWVIARFAPTGRALGRAILVAALGYWAVGIFPQLKYPANPPGVGDPATIGDRQGLYFGLLALSILAVLLAAIVYRDLGRLGAGWARRGVRLPIAIGVYAGAAAALLIFLPGNPDPIPMPLDLVATFRWLSIAGVTVFWLVLGAIFALFARRWTAAVPTTGSVANSPAL